MLRTTSRTLANKTGLSHKLPGNSSLTLVIFLSIPGILFYLIGHLDRTYTDRNVAVISCEDPYYPLPAKNSIESLKTDDIQIESTTTDSPPSTTTSIPKKEDPPKPNEPKKPRTLSNKSIFSTNEQRLTQIEKTCQKMKDLSTQHGHPELIRYFDKIDSDIQGFLNPNGREFSQRWSSFYYVDESETDKILQKYHSKTKNALKNPKLYKENVKKLHEWDIKNPHLFCISPKTGTTHWRTTLIHLFLQNRQARINFEISQNKTMREHQTGRYKWRDPKEKYDLDTEDANHKDHQAQNVFKKLPSLGDKNHKEDMKRKDVLLDTTSNPKRIRVLNVRHPVERLYSAWNQKFNKNHWRVEQFRREFVNEKLMPGATETENHICHFHQFVEYFLKTIELNPHFEKVYRPNGGGYHGFPIEYHWHSMLWQCMPCTIDYDYVTNLETAHEDSSLIFTEVFGRPDIEIPPAYSSHSGLEDADALLNDDLRERLRERFRWELEMFGYQY